MLLFLLREIFFLYYARTERWMRVVLAPLVLPRLGLRLSAAKGFASRRPQHPHCRCSWRKCVAEAHISPLQIFVYMCFTLY